MIKMYKYVYVYSNTSFKPLQICLALSLLSSENHECRAHESNPNDPIYGTQICRDSLYMVLVETVLSHHYSAFPGDLSSNGAIYISLVP